MPKGNCNQTCIGAATLLLFAAGVICWLDTSALSWAVALVTFFRTRSPQACACFVTMYVVSSMSFVPQTPFEIFAGFCFGVPAGIVLDVLGRLCAASLSFLVARALLRRSGDSGICLERIGGRQALRGVGRAVDEQGFRFLVLFNLAYVPVALKNYGLGLVPEVRLHVFLLAILVIEVPIASMWACVGSSAADRLFGGGVLLVNETAAGQALEDGARSQNMILKAALLIVGIGSIFAVLHKVHEKVQEELDKAMDNADSLLPVQVELDEARADSLLSAS